MWIRVEPIYCIACHGKLKATFNPLLKSIKVQCSNCKGLVFETFSVPGTHIAFTRKELKLANAALTRAYVEWEKYCE